MSALSGSTLPMGLGPRQRSELVVANSVLLVVEMLHDLDHIRQTYYLCFSVSPLVWAILVAGFVPTLAAIWMSWQGNRCAAHLTVFAAVALSATLFTVHLFGGPALFGGFAVPYTRSGVDVVSWTMLWLLLTASIYAAVVGVRSLRNEKRASPLVDETGSARH